METFLLALTVVFMAELGDKSQLMAMLFAIRFPARAVLVGIAVAALFTHGLSVGVGAVVGTAMPQRTASLLAAAAFVGFGLWTLSEASPVGDPSDDAETRVDGKLRHGVVVVAGSVILAELGDKTMLASATLAVGQHPIPTWLGASTGMVAADALAIVVGRQLGDRLPWRALQIGSAVAFFCFAALLVIGAL